MKTSTTAPLLPRGGQAALNRPSSPPSLQGQQELPSLALPLLACAGARAERLNRWPNCILLGMFLIHYAQRTLIFSLLIRGGKPTPLYSFVLAFVFCTYNGYLQSRYLSQYAVYSDDWVTDPRFLTGGLFEYISAANYFGEVVEWCGYALASWSIQGWAFALFTFCTLVTRAQQHHQSEGPGDPRCTHASRWPGEKLGIEEGEAQRRPVQRPLAPAPAWPTGTVKEFKDGGWPHKGNESESSLQGNHSTRGSGGSTDLAPTSTTEDEIWGYPWAMMMSKIAKIQRETPVLSATPGSSRPTGPPVCSFS
ncbi:hypothetical protein CB1_064113005 [Camelus ferus]|nr:hypothetical protein CB1_064113005 [Camelus ferus]